MLKRSAPAARRVIASLVPVVIALSFLGVGASPVCAGPLTVDALNPRWLVKDGAPYFFCGAGDPENFLHRGTRNTDGTRTGDQVAIIEEMFGTNANILWMTAVRSHGGDGGPTENPFINNDPNQGVNTAVLDQWEEWIAMLDAAGIVTFFVFYDDGARPWNTGDVVGPQENAFFTAVVDRFQDYDHLIWCIGEEYEEAYSVARVAALAALITSLDGSGHPIAGHQHEGTVFHFANDPSIDTHAMHCGPNNTPTSLHTKVVQAWTNAANRYHVIMAESIDQYSGDRTAARKLSWAAAMGGSTVMVHGLNIANTPAEALADCGRLRSFFAQVPFAVMAPADALKRGATEYVYGAPGVGYLLYASSGTGSLGFSASVAAAGPANLHWFDPITGTTDIQIGVPVAVGDNLWARPPGIGAEAALAVMPAAPTASAAALVVDSWGAIKSRFVGRQ